MSSAWRDFGGINEGYAVELYERFLKDPASVDAGTRAIFSEAVRLSDLMDLLDPKALAFPPSSAP